MFAFRSPKQGGQQMVLVIFDKARIGAKSGFPNLFFSYG
jgi:hypothetical protein